MVKIDEIDRKILFALDQDARQSVNEIAKKLGMKRDTVAYRIRRLEEEQVIRGYYAVIDYAKLGYQFVRLYFRFQNAALAMEEEMIQYLTSMEGGMVVYRTEGDWDVAVGFLVHSLEEFDAGYRSFQARYRKFINTQDIAVFLEYVHYYRNYLIAPQAADYTLLSTGRSVSTPFDDTDIKILQCIAGHANISLLALAQELNMTAMAIRYRIAQLEKKRIILGYRALIDTAKIGYAYYKVDLEIEDISKLPQLRQWACQHPNIIYEDRTIGGSDFEFDAELPSHEAFYALIDEIKQRFPGILRSYRYYRAREIYKYRYFPGAENASSAQPASHR